MANGKFKIKVETESNTAGIQEVQKELAQLKQQAGQINEKAAQAKQSLSEIHKTQREEAAKTRTELEKLAQEAALFDDGPKGWRRIIAGIASGFNILGATIAGVTVAIVAGRKAFQEFAEAQENVFRLDAAMRRVGALTDQSRASLQEMAGELQNLTGIADDEWIKSMTRLVQFGADPARMKEYISVVKNAAGVFDGDVRAATEAVTRALAGQYDGFTRLGLRIPETTDSLKKWQGLVMELERVGGGQLEAMASGAAGSMRHLRNSINDTFESIGGLLAVSPQLVGGLKLAKEAADFLAGSLSGVIDRAEGMENIFQRTVTPLEENAAAAQKLAKNLEAIDTAAKKLGRTLSDEEEAFVALKEMDDKMARSAFDVQVKTIDASNATPEEKEMLKARAQQRFDAGQAARDRGLRDAQIGYRNAQIKNEEARLEAARIEMVKAEEAVKQDEERSAKLEKKLEPYKKDQERYQQNLKKAQEADFSLGIHISNLRIKQGRERMERVTAAFNRNNPPRDPDAVQRYEAARNNYNRVRGEVGQAKYGLQKDLGRSLLEKDVAEETVFRRVVGEFAGRPEMQQAIQERNPRGTGAVMQGNRDLLQQVKSALGSGQQEERQVLQQILQNQQRHNQEVQKLRYEVDIMGKQNARARKW